MLPAPKLIEDWRSAWKWASVRFQTAAVAVQGAWLSLSDDMKADFPKHAINVLTVVLLIMGIGGRLIKQVPKEGGDDNA